MSFGSHAAPLVWIVEDDEDNREVVADVLGSEGYRTRSFADGVEALEAAACEATALPDLILLDFVMPRMDGAAFLKARAAVAGLAAVPVVLVSGARSAAKAVAGVDGVDAVALLPKPFDLDALLAAVGRVLAPAVDALHAETA